MSLANKLEVKNKLLKYFNNYDEILINFELSQINEIFEVNESFE